MHHAGMLDRQVEVRGPGVLRWPLRCFNTSADGFLTWNLALRWSAWHAAYICITWPHQLQTEPCSPEYITMIPYDFLTFSAFCCQIQCPEISYGHGHMPQTRRGKMQGCCHAVQLIDPNGVHGAETQCAAGQLPTLPQHIMNATKFRPWLDKTHVAVDFSVHILLSKQKCVLTSNLHFVFQLVVPACISILVNFSAGKRDQGKGSSSHGGESSTRRTFAIAAQPPKSCKFAKWALYSDQHLAS